MYFRTALALLSLTSTISLPILAAPTATQPQDFTVSVANCANATALPIQVFATSPAPHVSPGGQFQLAGYVTVSHAITPADFDLSSINLEPDATTTSLFSPYRSSVTQALQLILGHSQFATGIQYSINLPSRGFGATLPSAMGAGPYVIQGSVSDHSGHQLVCMQVTLQ